MRTVILFLVLIITSNIIAQQEYQVNHFMNDFISINPGSAGSSDAVNANAIYKRQWSGIEGTPEDIIINVDFPFRLFKAEHGAGVAIYREGIGFQEDISFKIAYAYKISLRTGKLGIGAGLNIQSRGINAEWFIPNGDPNADAIIPNFDNQVFAYDVNFGLFYKTEDLYFGLSSTRLLESPFKYPGADGEEAAATSQTTYRHYYMTSGYNIQLSNPSFEIIPSVFLQSDGKIHKLDINAMLTYNKKIWGGLSYRIGSAVIAFIGFELINSAKVGFSYDYPTTALSSHFKSAYEVFVNYKVKLGVEKSPKRYKTIRIL